MRRSPHEYRRLKLIRNAVVIPVKWKRILIVLSAVAVVVPARLQPLAPAGLQLRFKL
jgi:hypothetical protein